MNERRLKISELAQRTQLSITTIHYYVREGLIPQPIRKGKTVAFYTDDHLKRISFIKRLQQKKKISRKEMREEIKRKFGAPTEGTDTDVEINRKKDIINSVIELFREKGYHSASITHIVERANIGKGTFYLNFKNKEELLIECADRIFFEMYGDVWKEIRDEKDMTRRFIKRMQVFVQSYPQWVDMMNMLRGASVNKNPAFVRKLKDVMNQIIEPMKRDLDRIIKTPEFKHLEKIDTRMAAYALMGMAEYCSYLYYNDGYDEKAFTDAILMTLSNIAPYFRST